MTCPLCGSRELAPFARAHGRSFVDCAVCRLVHLVPGDRLDRAAEQRHYGTHENDAADLRYRGFLDRLALPLAEKLAPGARGLDYGSGPSPVLALMLSERGFEMAIYDPFFAPDQAVLAATYDFVTCSEVAEHFFAPGAELERLAGLLRPGAWLGVMTEVLEEGRVFADWAYARDPTHVCFYREATLAWIAARHGWTLLRPGRNVALFRAV
jgi:hypothetical protein